MNAARKPVMKATPDRFMAMKGQGYYSKATTGAKEVIDGATPLVIEAIDRMKLADDGRVIRVADMGCADGGTSIDLWRKALKHIRLRAPSRPIEIVYSDLPRNDFSQLFRIVHGQSDAESYLGEIDNVFVFASANSFHRAIFPPASLHLGFSSTASHYISKIPCEIGNHVHMVGAKARERALFAAQGAEDLRRRRTSLGWSSAWPGSSRRFYASAEQLSRVSRSQPCVRKPTAIERF